ncbi:MAG: hypothetical protein SGBAC_012253 [Bacillariaceae sp.]
MTTNDPEPVSCPPYLAHMSMEEEDESDSQSLLPRAAYFRTYNSMDDTSDESSGGPQTQESSSVSRISEQMQQELHHRHVQLGGAPTKGRDPIPRTTNQNGVGWWWWFPKKKKKGKRRRGTRTYNRQENDRFLAEMQQQSTTTTGSNIHIVGWIWGIFLFMTLGWVCVFTLSEGHIDWAEIINYEPRHQTPALQKKQGLRLLSFFGIGYLLPGVVSLLSLFVGLQLPLKNQHPGLSKLVQLPRYGTTYWSKMDLHLLLLFVIVLVGSFLVRFWHKYIETDGPHWTPDTLWRYIVKISGMSLVTILLVVLVPICKTCFWWDVFGLGFDRVIKFHRLLGALFGIILLLHGLGSLVYLDMVNQLYSCWTPWSTSCEKSMVVYGWYSGILFLPVFLTCFPWIRRNRYELFYYCHLLVIPALLMAHLHHINLIYYTSPSLVAYTLDKIVGYFAARRPVQLVDLSVPVEGYTRMTLAVDPNNADFSPGQWIKVKVPAISNWEWHPFSITSAPNQSTIALDIKDIGGWSGKLQQLAKSIAASSNSQSSPTKPDSKKLPSVYLDRYQGCDHTQGFLDHRAALLVGGGIGITPMMSVLRSLAAAADDLLTHNKHNSSHSSHSKLEHLVFVWVVRNESVLDLYREELQTYQALGGFIKNGRKCKLDILVYVTKPGCCANELVVVGDATTLPLEWKSDKIVKQLGNSAPFSKTLLGHMHHALLMIAVGLGFLRGIVSGSSFASIHEWRQEFAVLLQLGLGLIFSSILGAIVILGATLRWKSKKRRRIGNVGSKERYDEMDPENPAAGSYRGPLEVHRGERPNLRQIVAELKEQCLYNDITSVGVSVCGPDRLTKSVLTSVYEASTPKVEFVMGEESFEW